ncbi:MAG TPA: secondary thiamine-phosphate synthase enzyme YjbQ [Candidatus Acidoferrales bacterium]|nr:secondary thiamine-phosphate synthase enzyme YjbQ [Candidatus Acidoferrales bacterium]
MRIHTRRLVEETQGFCDIIDLTPKVEQAVASERIARGLAALFVFGSTAALTTVEYEPGLIQDLKEFFETIIPSNRKYHHDDRWGDDNGFAHLRASLLGPSLQVPIENGRLALGTWQQIILVDFDNRPRRREVVLELLGESE